MFQLQLGLVLQRCSLLSFIYFIVYTVILFIFVPVPVILSIFSRYLKKKYQKISFELARHKYY